MPTKIQRLFSLPAAKLTPDPSLLKRGEKIHFLKGYSPSIPKERTG
jgi:hypothetical protein